MLRRTAMISFADLCVCSCLCTKCSLFVFGLILAFFLYRRKVNNYFPSKGVKSIPVIVPLFGNMFKVFMLREHMSAMTRRLYNAFPDERYVGMHQLSNPIVVITDPELIKQITIKDFDSFQDHISVVDEKMDPLFGNNLVALTGQKWRDMRATLSPAFTSSKMKGMFEFVTECGDDLMSHFDEELKKLENKDEGYLELEFKDLFTRYTNDVIASSAFGIKINSLKERNNEFITMGKEATNFKGIVIVKFFFMIVFPSLIKMLHITILSAKVSAFFRNLVLTTMQTREEQHIIRPDMIQLLMEAKKGSLKHESKEEVSTEAGFATVLESAVGKQSVKRDWTDDEITAQAVVFFLAGFETSSNLLCFVAHELAVNPHIQKRLQEEVDEVSAKCGEKVNYVDLHAMKYMDMVVTETLRFWPPGIALDRKCVKTYTLPPPNNSAEKGMTLNAGDGVWIPIHDIHRDPKYYENPDTFDPERFSEENKGSINPLTYLPFGIGPRNCIGSRFALMECKAIIFQLLQKFTLVPSAKTSNPMKISLKAITFEPENGFWIGIKKRDPKEN